MDLGIRSIEKIFTLTGIPEDFVPVSNLIIFPDEHVFYTFCYPHHIPQSEGYLYKFALDGSSWKRVSDGVAVLSEKIDTQLLLFFDAESKEFLLVKQEFSDKDNSVVSIHTVSYPLTPLLSRKSTLPGTIYITTAALLLLGAGFFLLRRRHHGKTVPVKQPQSQRRPHDPVPVTAEQQINAIYLLGDFAMYDRQGREIAFRLSSKIRQLFLLIFLHSCSSRKGISSEAITAILWPDKTVNQAKNIRAVTIKNLRDILADLDGIEMKKVNNMWTIRTDPALLFCDYTFILNSVPAELEDQSNEVTNRLLILLIRGDLLPTCSFRWLDTFRSDYEEHSIGTLSHFLSKAFSAQDHQKMLKITSAILNLDPFNEEVFAMELATLNRIGQHHHATQKYTLFVHEFEKAYGRKPQGLLNRPVGQTSKHSSP